MTPPPPTRDWTRAQLPPHATPAEPAEGVAGFSFYGGYAGVKKRARDDLALLLAAPGTRAAGVFTTNQVVAAPVTQSRARLAASDLVRAVIANSGNANACTGAQGDRDAAEMAAIAARALREAGHPCEEREVQVCSTGVIGAPLPVDKIAAHAPAAAAGLRAGGLEDFARAIMTTDTRPKARALSLELPASGAAQGGGLRVRVAGASKGAGMIHPNMATMLAYVCTDAHVPAAALAPLWRRVCDKSFNAISIDGDTSTNDTALLLASGEALGAPPLTPAQLDALEEGLTCLARELALDILRDGEGVEHVLHLTVSGARSAAEARRVAETVALSPLVKTALNGKDPNWGRIIAAVGRSGVAVDPAALSLWIGDVAVYSRGAWQGAAAERAAHEVMVGAEYAARVDLGAGEGRFTLYGTDLSAEYVRINADYRS